MKSKMLTLQEMLYMHMDAKQREELPEVTRQSVERKFAFRILKFWKKSRTYRLKFIEKRIEAKEPLTKKAIVYAIRHKYFKGKVSVANLTDFLHAYFHNHKPEEYMSDEDMREVLDLFLRRSYNNAHLFFGQLWGMAINSAKVYLNMDSIFLAFRPLSKEILLGIYAQK